MRHRFHLFVEEPLAVGARSQLATVDIRRADRVLRLRAGEILTVADPNGAVFEAVYAGAGAIQVGAAVEPAAPAAEVGVRLALDGRRADVAIEKLVELGVGRLGVLATAAADAADRVDRWQRVARAAAEQSRQPRLPAVVEPIALADALALPGAIVLSHEGADGGLDLGAPPIELLIGPPAGFREDELSAARACGVPVASLPFRTLRSETAAIVAAALALTALR